MTTKFKSSTIDLSNTFLAYTSGTKASVTGYKVNGVDLNNLFSPKSVSKSFNTFGTGHQWVLQVEP